MKLWIVYEEDYEGPYCVKYFLDKENAMKNFEERTALKLYPQWDEIETED